MPAAEHAVIVRCAMICALLLLPPLASGCALEPDVGGPLVERCANTDSDPANDVSFQRDLAPLIARPDGGCVECHTRSGSNPVGLSVGGLDLSSLQTLRAGGSRTAADIVLAGQPCESTLFLKLTSAPFGSQMPADGPPFWTDEELRLLADWIAEGAHDN